MTIRVAGISEMLDFLIFDENAFYYNLLFLPYIEALR